MESINPFKLYQETQKQIEDVQREKHQIVSELSRLNRIRLHIIEFQNIPYQCVLQGQSKIEITTAIIYDNLPPINYFIDRYINPICHSQKVSRIDELAQDDQLHSTNSAFPKHFTNLAGLGGILGTQYGTGGRIPSVERHSCYVDELKQKIKPINKKETDIDYDRVSTLLLSLNQNLQTPFLVSQPRKIIPMGRILAEAASQNFHMQQQFNPISEQQGDSMQFPLVQQLIKQQNNSLLSSLAKKLIHNKQQVKEFCINNRCKPVTDKQKSFERDKIAVRNMKNDFQNDQDFSRTPGWIQQEQIFSLLQEKLTIAVTKIGTINFDIPLVSSKPFDKIQWEIFKLNKNYK